MGFNDDKITPKVVGRAKGQSIELYQSNGVTNIEAALKISDLRILMAIVLHLQSAIRLRIGRHERIPTLQDSNLPSKSDIPDFPGTRVITIPVSDFHMPPNNTSRLRATLDRLCHLPIVIPTSKDLSDKSGLFRGLIAGYRYPAYSTSVKLYIHDAVIQRLLFIEKGYTHYSYSLALSCESKYTLRLYWLICSWRRSGGFVISLESFKKLFTLGKGYERTINIAIRVLEPARKELESRFPIWFLYRMYDTSIAFKIKVATSAEVLADKRQKTLDFCFNILAQTGIRRTILNPLISELDLEDLNPFIQRVAEICAYIRNNRTIKDPNAYLQASIRSWLDDWSRRFEHLSE